MVDGFNTRVQSDISVGWLETYSAGPSIQDGSFEGKEDEWVRSV